jgi:ATP-dependent RNA helicase SUPV3L1/SUV3
MDGRGFTVTGSMTSLAGSSGADFASILRSLGYRMERRPKPPELPTAELGAAEPQGMPATAETAAQSAADAPSLPESEPPSTAASATEQRSEPAAVDNATMAAPTEANGIAPTEPTVAPAEVEAQPDGGDTAAPVAINPEEEFIEVWRPGRSEEQRRPRPHKRSRPPHERPAARPQTGSAEAPAGAEAAPPVPERAEPVAPPAAATARPWRDKKPRRERPDRERGGRAERGRGERPRFEPPPRPPPERREKVADPDSPFAKLLALKEQLEANAKERR